MINDPIVEEVRQAREAHAAQFGYDLRAIYEDIKKQQEASGKTFVSYPPRRIQPTMIAEPSQRAGWHGIRILVKKQSGAEKALHCWVDACHTGKNGEIQELVIPCPLTAESLQEAMDVIRQWITGAAQEPPTPAAKTSTPD